MRLLEIGILLLISVPLLWPFIGLATQKTRPGWLRWLAATAVLLVILHLFLEKYRWQMVPAYLLTLLIVLSTARRQRQLSPTGTAVLSGLGGVLGLIVAGALPFLLPVPQLPDPTGPYPIGTKTVYFSDTGQEEFYTEDPDDRRELMVQVWYPAATVAGLNPALYIEKVDIVSAELAKRLNLPGFLLDHLNLATTASFPEAQLTATEGPLPIIFFSHGLNGFRTQNSSMAQELASQGYVVISIDHTQATVFTLFPDERVLFYNPAIFAEDKPHDPPRNGHTLVRVWAQDVAFVLDQFTEWNDTSANFWHNRLNVTQVGMFGHSTGGGATVTFCLQDVRCAAGLGLDAWVLPASEATPPPILTQPFMFIKAEEWEFSDSQKNPGQTVAFYQEVNNDAYLLTVDDANHFDFSDLPLLSPLTPQLGLSSEIDGYYMAGILNRYVLAFFDRHLRGDNGTFLDEATPYPEINYQQRNGR